MSWGVRCTRPPACQPASLPALKTSAAATPQATQPWRVLAGQACPTQTQLNSTQPACKRREESARARAGAAHRYGNMGSSLRETWICSNSLRCSASRASRSFFIFSSFVSSTS